MADLHGAQGVQIGDGNHQYNQWHVWWHDRRIDAATLEALSASDAADLVAELPPREAAQALAAMHATAAAKVSWVLLHRDEALALSLLGTMNSRRSRPVVAELTAKFAWLEGLPDAAAAIEQIEVERRAELGTRAHPLARITLLDVHGFCRRYQRGAIYWSAKGGAQIIPEVYQVYHRIWLGFPLSPVTRAGPSADSRTTGSFQRYQGGVTVSSAAHGMHSLWGPIAEYYERVGGTGSWLGFPVSAESKAVSLRRDFALLGVCQQFEGGTVYWAHKTGAVDVRRDIAAYHDGLGGADGALGFPVGVTMVAGPSPFGTTGDFQRFEGGYDYPVDILDHWRAEEGVGGCTVYVSEHGVYAVGGGIGELYERINGTTSWLGFPTSAEIDARTAPDEEWCCYARFEGGAIYWKAAHGAVPVSRVVADLLSGDPGLARRLGFPTAPEIPILVAVNCRLQFFEHGLVTTRDGVPEAWLRPE